MGTLLSVPHHSHNPAHPFSRLLVGSKEVGEGRLEEQRTPLGMTLISNLGGTGRRQELGSLEREARKAAASSGLGDQ